MKRSTVFLFFVFLLAAGICRAQQRESVDAYILEFRELAIAEMQRTGVPAAIKLAQGIHETGAGTSKLVLKSNNHFGIKCKSTWKGESVSHDDDARGECFRKYPTALDSYKDHSDFLKNNQRYASLFALDPVDYKGWANGLKNAGYATNPKYPLVLIRLIEEYDLQDYTLIALGRLQPGENWALQESNNTDTANKDEGVSKSPDEVTNPVETRPVITVPVYPLSEFRINETKVIFLKKGTPYLTIARKYDVPLSRLFEFNELEEAEQTDRDQLIYLQRKRKSGQDDFHTVQFNETLHDIAQRQGIRLESLLELNSLKETDRPLPGEILSLRKKSTSSPKLALKENYSLVPGSNTNR